MFYWQLQSKKWMAVILFSYQRFREDVNTIRGIIFAIGKQVGRFQKFSNDSES